MTTRLIDPNNPIRECTTCHESKPIEQFRLRDGGKRRRRACNKCFADEQVIRYRVVRTKQDKREMAAFALAIRRSRSLKRVDTLVTATLEYFGGMENFTQLWANSVLAMKGNPGKVVKACESIGRLIYWTSLIKLQAEAMQAKVAAPAREKPDQTQPDEPGWGTEHLITNADIEREIQKYLASQKSDIPKLPGPPD